MTWHKPFSPSARLRDYYFGFALVFPPALVLMFVALKLLFRLPFQALVIPWALTSSGLVLGGASLLFWAHKRALRTGSLRPTVLAVELLFLCGLSPVGYFLVKTEGFDFWPLMGTLLIVLASFAPLYWYTPRRARERLEAARRAERPDHEIT